MKKSEPKYIDEHFVSCAFFEQLIFLVGKAIQKSTRYKNGTLGPLGLSWKQMRILLTLQRKISINQNEISGCVCIDRSTIVTMIDDLEKRGIVQRVKNSADRRSYKILLTAKGKELMPKAKELVVKSQSKLLSCLAEDEQKFLMLALRKIIIANFVDTKLLKESL